jgi:hypothetical protein
VGWCGVAPDGAKLAGLAVAIGGARSAREVARLTRRKLRTVERHYAELRASRYASERSGDTPGRGCPRDKKKGLPRTPSKEKTQSPPVRLQNPKSSSIDVAASSKAQPPAEAIESRQALVTGLVADWRLEPALAERAVGGLAQHYGWPFAAAYRKLRREHEEGASVKNPLGLLRAICARLNAQTPVGAILYEDGTYLSRWGSF